MSSLRIFSTASASETVTLGSKYLKRARRTIVPRNSERLIKMLSTILSGLVSDTFEAIKTLLTVAVLKF
jgi:hypothetical protein